MKLSYTALAFVALSGGAAVAGGYSAPVVEPVVATPVYETVSESDWTGFYAGGQINKLDGSLKFKNKTGVDAKGNAYGLHAGYLHDMGQFVLGGEVTYDKLNKIDVSGSKQKLDGSKISGKLMAGYDAGNFLPYATVGYSKMTLNDFAGKGRDADGNGYLFGVGAKFKATDNVLVGAEVLKHKFKDFGDAKGADLDATTFGVNVSYKF